MSTEWRDIWQYGKYHLWERKNRDGKYLYNVTTDSHPPANDAGYYGVFTLLALKNIPIHVMQIRREIDAAIERQ